MRNMQKMWEDYAKEVQVLRERIAELREVLQRDKTRHRWNGRNWRHGNAC